MEPDAAATVWARAHDVLWRLGPDRVVARPVGGDGLELVGAAAMVWVALAEPQSGSAVASELVEAGVDRVLAGEALAELLARGLVVERS